MTELVENIAERIREILEKNRDIPVEQGTHWGQPWPDGQFRFSVDYNDAHQSTHHVGLTYRDGTYEITHQKPLPTTESLDEAMRQFETEIRRVPEVLHSIHEEKSRVKK